jgi:hypothetical protein
VDINAALAELGPSPNTYRQRVQWVGDKFWDFAEGKLSRNALELLPHLLLGWQDLASDDEREGYRTLARQARDLLRADVVTVG